MAPSNIETKENNNDDRTDDTITGIVRNGIHRIDVKEGSKNKVTRATCDDENTPTKKTFDVTEGGDNDDLLFSPTTSSHISKGTSRKKKRCAVSSIASPIATSKNSNSGKRKSDNLESFEFEDVETKGREGVEITPPPTTNITIATTDASGTTTTTTITTTNDATTIAQINKIEYDNMVDSLEQNKISLISLKKENNLARNQNKELKDINKKLLSESSKLRADNRTVRSKNSELEEKNKMLLADKRKLEKEKNELENELENESDWVESDRDNEIDNLKYENEELQAKSFTSRLKHERVSESFVETKALLKLLKDKKKIMAKSSAVLLNQDIFWHVFGFLRFDALVYCRSLSKDVRQRAHDKIVSNEDVWPVKGVRFLYYIAAAMDGHNYMSPHDKVFELIEMSNERFKVPRKIDHLNQNMSLPIKNHKFFIHANHAFDIALGNKLLKRIVLRPGVYNGFKLVSKINKKLCKFRGYHHMQYYIDDENTKHVVWFLSDDDKANEKAINEMQNDEKSFHDGLIKNDFVVDVYADHE